VGAIGRGLLILMAVEVGDSREISRKAAEKIAGMRIFADDGSSGKMTSSLLDSGGEALIVSQFTLAASLRKGRRPSFEQAAAPDEARALCDHFSETMKSMDINVSTGRFGAMMEVELINDGPVTFWLQSTANGEFGP
jgi:D-tyrosyl-tRNA(Tyr) deacylase